MPQHSQQNFLARIVAAIVSIIVLGIAVFLGAFFIAALVGLALLFAIVLSIRIWWLRRKYGSAGIREPHTHDGRTIEGEYTVKKRDTDL